MNRIFCLPIGFMLGFVLMFINVERQSVTPAVSQKPSNKFAQQTRRIAGEVVGLRQGQLIYLQSAQRIMLDSVRATTNGFIIERQLAEPNLYHVLIGKENLEFQLVWDTDIVISGSLKKPEGIIVKGSPLTDEWKAYLQTYSAPKRTQLIRLYQDIERLRSANDTSDRYKALRAKNDSIGQSTYVDAKNYIQKHPVSFISLYLLSKDWEEIGNPALLTSLSDPLQEHSLARALKKAINNNETAQLGSVMPDFNLKTLTGQPFTSRELTGRYTLIDFWGTWCGPCLALTPELIRIHDTFRGDSVQFVGFVCEKKDINPNAIQQFARKRGMTWQQVPIDLRDTTTVDKTWEILSFPTFILVGPDRHILARGDGGDGLNQCINVLSKRRKP